MAATFCQVAATNPGVSSWNNSCQTHPLSSIKALCTDTTSEQQWAARGSCCVARVFLASKYAAAVLLAPTLLEPSVSDLSAREDWHWIAVFLGFGGNSNISVRFAPTVSPRKKEMKEEEMSIKTYNHCCKTAESWMLLTHSTVKSLIQIIEISVFMDLEEKDHRGNKGFQLNTTLQHGFLQANKQKIKPEAKKMLLVKTKKFQLT